MRKWRRGRGGSSGGSGGGGIVWLFEVKEDGGKGNKPTMRRREEADNVRRIKDVSTGERKKGENDVNISEMSKTTSVVVDDAEDSYDHVGSLQVLFHLMAHLSWCKRIESEEG